MEWINQNLMSIISLTLTVIGTPLLAWLFSRSREKAEIDKTKADSAGILITSSGDLVNLWQNFADEIQEKYDKIEEQFEQIKERYEEAQKTNRELLATNRNLLATNNDLVTQIERLQVNLKAYMNGITQLFEIMVVEIEKTNPDLAAESRAKFVKISKLFEE